MSGIAVALTGNFAVLDTLKHKVTDVSKTIANGFQNRIGAKMFDGILSAVSQLGPAIKDALDAGGALSDMVARTGAAGEGLVILQQMFVNAGISAEGVAPALNRMQKALAGVNEDGEPTNKAFAKIGLTLGELSALDPAAAFTKIAGSIAGIKDPAERSARAMEIFGRGGAELLVVMTDPAAFATAAKQLGTLPQTLTANMGAFDSASDALGLLGVKTRELGVEVASALLPQINAFTEWAQGASLKSVGEGIGTIVNALATVLPFLDEAVIALGALKLMSLASGLQAAASGLYVTATAAVAASGGFTAMATAAGAALVILLPYIIALGAALVAYQAIKAYTEHTQQGLDAMTGALDRGNAAVKKFNVNDIKATAASREEIAAKLQAIQEEKAAVEADVSKLIAGVDDPEVAASMQQDLKNTLALLDSQATRIAAITDAQLAANQAKRDAAAAEIAYADAMKESAKAYEAAKKTYDEKVANAAEQKRDALPPKEQIQAVEKEAQRLLGGLSFKVAPGSTTESLGKQITEAPDHEGKGKDLEILNQILDLEQKRIKASQDLAKEKAEKAKEDAEKATKIKQATADYEAELKMINAQIEGNATKIRQLQQEAELRDKIAQMVEAGITPKTAEVRANELVALKNKQPLADARRQAAALKEDAAALMGGEKSQAYLKARRRSKELQDGGLDQKNADALAGREMAMDRLTELKSKRSALQQQTSIGAVSSMQRIGGGGGAVSNGLDYNRQQTELQRQMAAALELIAGKTAAPSLEF